MSTERSVYAGLDVGSRTCHLVAVDPQGSVVADRKFVTSEKGLIRAFESLKGKVHVHLEAGELARWIRQVLSGRVAGVIISDPRSLAWISKDPLKRDRLDAYKLAELLRMGRTHPVYYSQDDHRALFKQLVKHYDDLTRQEVRLKVKIKGRFREQGVIAQKKDVYRIEGRKPWLDRVRAPLAREAILQLYSVLDETLARRKDALRLVKREAERYPEIARFQQVPGVGLLGASRFSAYVQTPHRFSSKRKLWRYCRLGVTDRSSDGKPLGRRRLDWNGNGALKDMSRSAFMAALRSKADNAFKRFYARSLRTTHDGRHARLSTQRKILSVLRALWLRGESYDDERA